MRRLPLIFGLFLLAAALAATVWWMFSRRGEEIGTTWDAVVTTIAGGTAGLRDGDARRARFLDPFGVAGGQDGSILVADGGNARIRRISADQQVTTIAGGEPGFADGVGTAARFNTPSGVAISADSTIYIADTGNNAIRRLTADGTVSTLAGDGAAGYADGPAAEARFNGPVAVAVDGAGRVIVADTYNDRVRAIQPDGAVLTLAGEGIPGYQDGATPSARFNTPSGVAVSDDGSVYVADTGNDAVRMISPSGIVSTILSQSEELVRPTGIATAGTTVYVSDERGRVVVITPDAGARILAGSGPGLSDGPGPEARFRAPSGLALVGPGKIVVADRRNAAIRLIAARYRPEVGPPSPPFAAIQNGGSGRAPLLWPLVPFEGPHEITGTLGEARGTQSERLHAGLDIHAAEGTTVHAVRSGVISDVLSVSGLGTLTESLRVGSVTYVHARIGRERRNEPFGDPRFVFTYDDAGQLTQLRAKRGARFRAGEPIGTVNGFNHVHLNIGWPGEEVNPLDEGLVQFEDTVPPTIARGGVRLFGENWEPLTARRKRRVLLSGPVRIVVDAWDQVDGNARRRRLGVYRLGYQILHADGTPIPGFEVPRETIRFDRMPADTDTARLVYAPGSGIPEYGRRSTRFLYVVTTTMKGGVASPSTWDPSALPPGDYMVRIVAADIFGNVATVNRDLPVTIEAAGTAQ